MDLPIFHSMVNLSIVFRMLTRPGDQDGFGLLGLPEKCADLIGAPWTVFFLRPVKDVKQLTHIRDLTRNTWKYRPVIL